MESEWDSLWLLAGTLPILVVVVRKAWKWYCKTQSGSNETLLEHVTRIEKENNKDGKI